MHYHNNLITSNWVSVSNGLTHAVGIKQNGRLFSWGVGLQGQLGQTVQRINEMQRKYLGINNAAGGEIPKATASSAMNQVMGPSRYDCDERSKIS